MSSVSACHIVAIGILYREELKEYDFGPGHPCRGDRYERFPKYLRDNLAEDDNYRILEAGPVSDEDLCLPRELLNSLAARLST